MLVLEGREGGREVAGFRFLLHFEALGGIESLVPPGHGLLNHGLLVKRHLTEPAPDNKA